MERRGFGLRGFLHQAVEFRGRGLVEPGLLLQPEKADRLQQAQRADAIDIGGVFRRLEADRDMGLRAQVVDLVGLHLLQDAGQVRAVGQITVVQIEVAVIGMRILIDVVDALGVEQ